MLAGGDPRFVVLDQKGEMARVLDISQLSLKQIRLVTRKLGIYPEKDLMSVREINNLYLEDKMREARGETTIFDSALGIDDDDLLEDGAGESPQETGIEGAENVGLNNN